MARRSRIAEEGQFVQSGLFAPIADEKKVWNPFPKLSNSVEDFRRVLLESEGPLGLDFEFSHNYVATHIGIASETESVCVKGKPDVIAALINEVCDDVERRGRSLVGHATLGAERRVIEVMTGRNLALEYLDDSMSSHHLMNADLCGNVQKKEDEEEKGSLGFMGLNTTAHMSTLLPAWKVCPGRDCAEAVCPTHNKSNYCAVDAWASLMAHKNYLEEMETYGVHQWYYREKIELAELALEMEYQGVKVDRAYVTKFEAKSEEEKEKLFPYVMRGKTREFTVINPRSPPQIIEYFNANGIRLEKVDKKAVRTALEKQCDKYGFDIETIDDRFDTLPPTVQHLCNLDKFKSKGKGIDSWFGHKYVGTDDFIHPRWVTTGTAMDRWSSSRPNFQNIPARGPWGKLVKKAVIPRDPSLEIADADVSQLEFRMLLYQLGWDCKDIPTTIFEDLVEKSQGGFKAAADFRGGSERDIAKTVVYGSLYGQGLSLLEPSDLNKSNIQSEIQYGARRVYLQKFGAAKDWTYRGKIVSFTGKAMAKELFRDETFESRRKSLIITDDVLCSVYNVRQWQEWCGEKTENQDYVQCPYSGKILRLYGTIEEILKSTLSFFGQGCSTVHVQGILLRFKREMGLIPILAVHDSVVREFPAEWTDKQLKEAMRFMVEPTHRIPGFFTPAEIKRGPNYGTLRKLGFIGG